MPEAESRPRSLIQLLDAVVVELPFLARPRGVLIAAEYRADRAGDPAPEEIRAIRLAWADAAV